MLKTTQTGICFRANVFIYIEATLARKQLHRGIFRAKNPQNPQNGKKW